MYIIDEARHYWRWTAGYSNPNRSNIPNTTQHAYKPRALRIPSLLSLFFLFTISFTALEILLDKTVKPNEYYESRGLRAPEKRQAQPQQCPSPEENNQLLDSLRSRQSALCTTYTTTFKPSTTDLSPPMQTSFDSWLALYSAMEAQSEFAESCFSSQSYSSSLASLLNMLTSASTASSQSASLSSAQSASVAQTAGVQETALSNSQVSNSQVSNTQASNTQASNTEASNNEVSDTQFAAQSSNQSNTSEGTSVSATPSASQTATIQSVSNTQESSVQTPNPVTSISQPSSATAQSSVSPTEPSISTSTALGSSTQSNAVISTPDSLSAISTAPTSTGFSSASTLSPTNSPSSASGTSPASSTEPTTIPPRTSSSIFASTSSSSTSTVPSSILTTVSSSGTTLSTTTRVSSLITTTPASSSSTTSTSSTSMASTGSSTTSSSFSVTLSTTTRPSSASTTSPSTSASLSSSSARFANTTTTTIGTTESPPTTDVTTTTSSTALEPVCTEINSPCFECGFDYCICQGQPARFAVAKRQALFCGIDLCHCAANQAGGYDCTSEDLCSTTEATTTTASTTTASTTTASTTTASTTINSTTTSSTTTSSTTLSTTTGSSTTSSITTNSTTTRSTTLSTTTGSSTISSTTTNSTTTRSTTPSTTIGSTTTSSITTNTTISSTTLSTTTSLTTTSSITTNSTTTQSTTLSTTTGSTTMNTTTTGATTGATTTTSNSLTTTSSTSSQPVCTEINTPCFECGYDYCLCTEDDCEVDLCHCTPLETGGYECSSENTCSAPSTTSNCSLSTIGTTCNCESENYSMCICDMSPSYEAPTCVVDPCHCQYSADTDDFVCGESFDLCADICSGPLSEGTDCQECDASGSCTCQEGFCLPNPCDNEGDTCHSCDAQMCTCGYTGTKRQAGLTCVVDPCYCEMDFSTGNYTCDAYNNLCECRSDADGQSCSSCESDSCTCQAGVCTAAQSSATTTTATTTQPVTTIPHEPALPGATCDPSYYTCYNCVADRCACGADGYCYVDEQCYCDYIAPGEYVCGTLDRCNPDACDTSILQCSGCDPDDASASCYCTYDGVCETTPCTDCEFSEDGTVMACADGCESGIGKRSPGFNSSSIPRDMEVSNGFVDYGRPPRRRGWSVMDKRDGVEILTGNFQTPVRDAWNYLLWTEPLVVRRTSSSLVSTVTAATFTLDVFESSTSWPALATTRPLAIRPTVPACIPATLIAPAAVPTTIVKRDVDLKSVKPYVTRESTTVVVRIRDNYLEMTSNVPTVTKEVPVSLALGGSALVQMTTYTMNVESVAANGMRETQSVVVVKPTTVGTGDDPIETGSRSESGDGGGAGGGGGASKEGLAKLSDHKRVVSMTFTRASYVAALYFPAMMAVVIKILFETIVASIKMMEPFERLHRSQGSSSEDSLSSQYLSSSLSFDVIRSIWSGRSIPLWTLIIYLLITIGAPISAASMTVRPMDTCLIDGGMHICDPAWIVDLNLVRTMEALLALCIALTVILAWASWTYHAGVPSNPTSIASMAVLLNYEPLRSDLQAIEPDANEKGLRETLGQYHFWLLPHHPSREQTRYGIIHAPVSPSVTPESWPWLRKLESLKQIFTLESRSLSRIGDLLHLLTTATLLALLTRYRANLNDDAFNRFFASSTFWPKFILVTLAIVIDMQWKNLEREVRITEPYRRLYQGNARPENTILHALNGTCWSNLPRCVKALWSYDGMWFEALVGVIAILSDVNIIAVSGVLMTYSQTRDAYQWSSLMALTTTSIMLVVLLVTMFWWRRTKAVSSLPRTPETVAAVLSYLCISRMAVDFANMKMEDMSGKERDERIIALGRRYRFGLMMGEDGQERYCVDYDEDGGAEASERESWLQDKVARPTAVRLSSSTSG